MNTKKCDCSGRPLGTEKCETCQAADAAKEPPSSGSERRLVRHPLILPKRQRWFYAESVSQEEWEGPFKTLETALHDAIIQRAECGPRIDPAAPIWVGHGRRTTAAERADYGTTFDFHVDADEAFQVILPNKLFMRP